MTLGRAELAAQLNQHGLTPKRSLGQNFVVDANTVRRIARLAGVGTGDHVVEVGAGLGSLTLALAETGAQVVAVELDNRLLPLLTDNVAACAGVSVVHGNAMQLDWPSVLAGADSWSMVANLPYNIATPLVADLLDDVPAIERMLVMVQREVGERLAALPRSEAYGAVSVKVAYWATAAVVGTVPASVFLPRPNVESSLVQIVRRDAPAVAADRSWLFALVKAGFGKRRKMLRGSLAGLVSPEAFAIADVAPTARAEELDVFAWGRLAAASTPTDPPTTDRAPGRA